MYAIREGAEESVKALLDADADVYCHNNDGQTIFHLAALKNRTEILKVRRHDAYKSTIS